MGQAKVVVNQSMFEIATPTLVRVNCINIVFTGETKKSIAFHEKVTILSVRSLKCIVSFQTSQCRDASFQKISSF